MPSVGRICNQCMGFVAMTAHTHTCKLIALYTASAYSAEREMSASACTRSMAGSSQLCNAYVLASKNRCRTKGSSTFPSLLRRQLLDQERKRLPGDVRWLRSVLSSLQCFDDAGLVTSDV